MSLSGYIGMADPMESYEFLATLQAFKSPIIAPTQ